MSDKKMLLLVDNEKKEVTLCKWVGWLVVMSIFFYVMICIVENNTNNEMLEKFINKMEIKRV